MIIGYILCLINIKQLKYIKPYLKSVIFYKELFTKISFVENFILFLNYTIYYTNKNKKDCALKKDTKCLSLRFIITFLERKFYEI